MKREYLDQLAVWFHSEVEVFKVKGASKDILGINGESTEGTNLRRRGWDFDCRLSRANSR